MFDSTNFKNEIIRENTEALYKRLTIHYIELKSVVGTPRWKITWKCIVEQPTEFGVWLSFINAWTLQPDIFCPVCSFVRSVTMDKWKDIELEKMKAGGNGKFRLFLELQDDYDPTWTLQEKYNSKAAALFRDKV